MSASLDAVYAPFVASLLAGGFGPPPDGEWPAELVAAHIARNNDLIAELAKRIAGAGQPADYDNATGVDEAELGHFASSVGGLAGLAGLAREVERSAARLERARDALGDKADTPVQVTIRDHGEIVSDGPRTIGAFIDGPASSPRTIPPSGPTTTLSGSWAGSPARTRSAGPAWTRNPSAGLRGSTAAGRRHLDT